MKFDVWKPCSDQRWQDELLFSIWSFFEQSAFVNIHLLCYWPTIHNSILKICPKFQVISSHFFKVNEALWALSKTCAKWNISTPIYVECDNRYQSKVCVQEFLYFVYGFDIQLEKKTYDHSPSTTVLYAIQYVAGVEIQWVIQFFFSDWYEPMAHWLSAIIFFFLDFVSGDLALTEL